MKFTVPVRVVNASNERSHWTVKAKRAKAEKLAAASAARTLHGGVIPRGAKSWCWASPPMLPVTVTLTRIYTRKRMDRDGNVTSLKAIQDAVADLLGIDDGDEDKVTWRYAQAKGAEYAVEVEVVPS